MPFITKPTQRDWERMIQDAVHALKQNPASLVVWDTLSHLWCVSDENDNAKEAAALMPLRQLSDTGASLALVHHFGAEKNGPRGGTELRQEPRLREPCGIPVRHAHTELVLEASGLGTAERPQVRAIGLEHPVELREVGGLAEDQSLVATAGVEDRQARAGRRVTQPPEGRRRHQAVARNDGDPPLADHTGGRFIDEGCSTLQGRLPVNPSGGLLACGHPVVSEQIDPKIRAMMGF